jgi:hypothetical protein
MVGRNFAKEQPADSSKFLWNSDSALVVAVRVNVRGPRGRLDGRSGASRQCMYCSAMQLQVASRDVSA